VSRDKLLERMANNPAGGFSIGELKTVAARHGVSCRQGATSHVVFLKDDGRTLVVPARRPIKPVYVRKFVTFLEG
jgi:hypothetical protein